MRWLGGLKRWGACTLALVLFAAGCAGGDSQGSDPTLAAAVCLSHDGDWGVPEPAACMVDLATGDRSVLVAQIAPAERVALSPDRSRVLYLDIEGRPSTVTVAVPHTVELALDEPAAAPSWLTDQTIAVVDGSRRRVLAVPVGDPDNFEVVLDLDELDGIDPDEHIYWFSSRSGVRLIETRVDGEAANALFSLLLVVDGGAVRLVPLGEEFAAAPDIHPNEDVIAAALGSQIVVLDLDGSTIAAMSPAQWFSATPSWSPSGTELVWLSEGVGKPYPGPGVLFRSSYPSDGSLDPVVGNNDQPFDRLPAFPDW